MDEFNSLIYQTCQYQAGSIKRRQSLNRLVQAVIKSGKLWRESTPYYEDALQQTWLYLCRNLCESNTGAQYNPEISSVTTWLNGYLQKRLKDIQIKQIEKNHIEMPLPVPNPENPTPRYELPAPAPIPPILEEIKDWVERDSDGEFGLIHIKSRQDLTCQLLILRRLPPETDWKSIAVEFDCSISTLANFYQRQCLPRLRKFGESQGYL